jgi:sugar phosphate isomerase/epimerase
MTTYGISTCASYHQPVERALAQIAEMGFREIELSGGEGYWEDWQARPAERMRRWLEAAGLVARSVHAQGPWTLADPDPALRRAAVMATTNSFLTAALVGAEFVVVHPMGWRGSHDPEEYRQVYDWVVDDLAACAERAERVGVRMAVENIYLAEAPRPGSSVSELLALIEGLGEHVGICLDTGHAHVDHRDPAEEALLAGDKLFTLHIADNDQVRDQHWLPGRGTIDWASFLAALDRIGFQGPRMLEVCDYGEGDPDVLVPGAARLAREWERR